MTDKTGQKCFGRKNNNIQRNYEFYRLVIHTPQATLFQSTDNYMYFKIFFVYFSG